MLPQTSPVRFGKVIADRDEIKSVLREEKYKIFDQALESLGDPVNVSEGPFDACTVAPSALETLDAQGVDVQIKAGQKDVDGDLFRTLTLELSRDGKPVPYSTQETLVRGFNPDTLGDMLKESIETWLKPLNRMINVICKAQQGETLPHLRQPKD